MTTVSGQSSSAYHPFELTIFPTEDYTEVGSPKAHSHTNIPTLTLGPPQTQTHTHIFNQGQEPGDSPLDPLPYLVHCKSIPLVQERKCLYHFPLELALQKPLVTQELHMVQLPNLED